MRRKRTAHCQCTRVCDRGNIRTEQAKVEFLPAAQGAEAGRCGGEFLEMQRKINHANIVG